jgi:hypothetical protein
VKFLIQTTRSNPLVFERIMNAKTLQGEDALQLAASSGHHELCRILYDAYPYDIFTQNSQGNQSFHIHSFIHSPILYLITLCMCTYWWDRTILY